MDTIQDGRKTSVKRIEIYTSKDTWKQTQDISTSINQFEIALESWAQLKLTMHRAWDCFGGQVLFSVKAILLSVHVVT